MLIFCAFFCDACEMPCEMWVIIGSPRIAFAVWMVEWRARAHVNGKRRCWWWWIGVEIMCVGQRLARTAAFVLGCVFYFCTKPVWSANTRPNIYYHFAYNYASILVGNYMFFFTFVLSVVLLRSQRLMWFCCCVDLRCSAVLYVALLWWCIFPFVSNADSIGQFAADWIVGVRASALICRVHCFAVSGLWENHSNWIIRPNRIVQMLQMLRSKFIVFGLLTSRGWHFCSGDGSDSNAVPFCAVFRCILRWMPTQLPVTLRHIPLAFWYALWAGVLFENKAAATSIIGGTCNFGEVGPVCPLMKNRQQCRRSIIDA